MPHLLADLEIDAACWEYLAQRIVAHGGTCQPQLVVRFLDNFCETCEADPCMCTVLAPPEDDETDPWDELTAECQRIGSGPETVGEMTERMLGKMGV
jgi:hypothetical protein